MVTPLTSSKRRRTTLTTDAAVLAARRLIEAKGMEALSMRGLTAALGVQAPALYRRIGSKEALLALVLDHVMGDLAPPDDGPWQDQLAELMRRLRALFARKPRLATLFAYSTPHGPNALRFIEAASAPLRRAGFSEAQTGFAITTLTTYVIGFTFLAAGRSSGPVHRQIQATLRRERPAGAAASAYAVLEHTQRGDADRVFEFGLRHLIAGLASGSRRFFTAEAQRHGEIRSSPRPLRCSARYKTSDEKGSLMHTPLCDKLGIEFPIFAFTHCRDVVAAVSKAGGFGVLGAVGFTPEQLEIELKWIDEHIGDKPYGVDIVIPGKYEGMGEIDPEKLEQTLRAIDPASSTASSPSKILADHGVPKLPEGEQPAASCSAGRRPPRRRRSRSRSSTPKVKLIANALGTPPADVIERDPRRRPARRRAVRRGQAGAARTRRPASTSSSRRAPRAAATPARSAASCSGPR